MLSSKGFSVVNLLVTLLTVMAMLSAPKAHALVAASMPLLDADRISAEWVSSEALTFNVGQSKLLAGIPYEKQSPEIRTLAYSRICQFAGTMLGKINQVDLSQNNRYAQCGFKDAKEILEHISCNGTEAVTAQQLEKRHTELLRASAAINLSGYESPSTGVLCN